jgi:hypothetical protein
VRCDADAETRDRELARCANTMNIDFPFHFDQRGCTASASDDDHIRDMIEEFYSPIRASASTVRISAAACCRWCSAQQSLNRVGTGVYGPGWSTAVAGRREVRVGHESRGTADRRA